MTNLTGDISQIVVFIGVMAFIVSAVTEALKKWTWFDSRVPTALTVIVLSLVLWTAGKGSRSLRNGLSGSSLWIM